jgi:hypothetical protein
MCRKLSIDGLHAKATNVMNQRDSAVDRCSRHRQHAHGDDDEPIGDGGSFRSHMLLNGVLLCLPSCSPAAAAD